MMQHRSPERPERGVILGEHIATMRRGPDGEWHEVPDESLSHPAPPAPSGRLLFKIKKIDPDAVRAVDPLWPDVFPLFAELEDGTELTHEGVAIARLERTSEASRRSFDLSIEGYELLVQQHGQEDDGATDDRWSLEGTAAMRAVLEDLPPASGLRHWRGEREGRLRQAEAVGRAHAMTADAIALVTGRPFIARRSLLAAGSMARLLEERARIAAEVTRAAEAIAEAARVEAARPKTCAELGIEAIAVDVTRSTGAPLRPNAWGGSDIDPALVPYPGAQLLWQTASHLFFGYRAIEGLELPAFDHNGVRRLGPGECAFPTVVVRAPVVDDWQFALQARRRFGGDYDLGPIAAERWTERGLDGARELARRYVDVFARGPGRDAFRRDWLAQAIVRGHLVRPDLAAATIGEAEDRVTGRPGLTDFQRERLGVDPHEWMSAPYAELCMKAAGGGDISVGALLDAGEGETVKRTKGKR